MMVPFHVGPAIYGFFPCLYDLVPRGGVTLDRQAVAGGDRDHRGVGHPGGGGDLPPRQLPENGVHDRRLPLGGRRLPGPGGGCHPGQRVRAAHAAISARRAPMVVHRTCPVGTASGSPSPPVPTWTPSKITTGSSSPTAPWASM